MVDESALRYFASHGDTKRLKVEIARLQALYPNWVPPADPLAIPTNNDTQLEAMWKLYADGSFAELRGKITERQSNEPNWQPPSDLLERLDIAEARTRLVNSSEMKQYSAVIDIAAQTPVLLTCAEMDVLWRVAEAFVKTDRESRSVETFAYILQNCTEQAERLATMQKAAELLSYKPVQQLLSYERRGIDGAGEFEAIRNDLARRFVNDANEDPKLVIDPSWVTRLEQLATTTGDASDLLLLGWYQLGHKQIAEAEKSFRASRTKKYTAAASQGLALTLLEEDKPQEAEDAMYALRHATDDTKATYLAATARLMARQPPLILDETILARIAAEVIVQKDATTAQEFGWYARTFDQMPTAAGWFETALAWKPDDEPSAYGLALTLYQLKNTLRVSEIKRQWKDRSPRIAAIGGAADASTGLTAAPDGKARRGAARRGCSNTLDPRTLSPQTALTRGWCLMDKNRPLEAIDSFEVAIGGVGQTRADGVYGQSLAYLRLGLADNAAVAAARAPLPPSRAAELQTAILSKRVTNAFDAGRYRQALLFLDQRAQFQPEPIDLMVLRGYAYQNLGMVADAIKIFEAAAATGNVTAMRALGDLRSERR
ncbi:hypothetical protein GCM10007920_13970 [Ciceribacter naphthalenivorans]|uniref:Cellulose synthase n=2 Tax=Alphaproteobacteria TaxID=28211 RepID=A0A512HNJ6_9HYPH|nr:hypothetical protein RNA01_39450 [Ciceribacter naphthalenivorans]GLR21611.1 hypothetical protein GCM10007920_13970 [Ciceribacter naphthalenivorans]GLT04467.1 hypothetical protein GCM10007926_13970 [Sphingomonas psychrolutea]